jgi:hypothetical protein
MAKTVASIGKEKTVATLARNLFVVDGPYTARLQQRAESALLAANPRLAEGLAPGATVVVPAVPGLGPSARAATASTDLEGLLTETAIRLKTAASSIDNGFAQSQARAGAALERLGQRQFVAAATKALPASRALIEEASKSIKERQAAEHSRRGEFTTAIDKALSQIDDLSGRVRRSAPK